MLTFVLISIIILVLKLKGVIMREFEKLDLLTKKGNGFLTTSSVIAESISKTTLAKYIREKNFERVPVQSNLWLFRHLSRQNISCLVP